MLSKKAELWRISCHEHAYFKAVEELGDRTSNISDGPDRMDRAKEVVREGKEDAGYRPHGTHWSPVFFADKAVVV